MSSLDALFWQRLQFAFTIVFHYLFPQLTMGLALLIVILKGIGLARGEPRWDAAARFWIRIFGINFALGVVTGIPMEFQFGTNWAAFSRFAGPIVGQTLAMEGLFAFFLESSFVALLVWGERRLSRRGHFLCALALFAGSWLSAWFILATNAFMQHPVGYAVAADGSLELADLGAVLTSPWLIAQYAHTMVAAVVTASFVMAAVGAYYVLHGRHRESGRLFLRVGTTAGLVASVLVAFPTGDAQARLVARNQPIALAAMEGRFDSGPHAGITLIGQPNVAERRLDNPIVVPGALSLLAYGTFHGDVKGLDAFPVDQWPDNIELLYYAFHVMAGLGTLSIALMLVGCVQSWRGRLERNRRLLGLLMLAFPIPYVATTAGWLTAELGRQPWIVYGLMRTRDGASPTVHAGTALFTLLGFVGLYFLLGLLFVFLVAREISHGPGHPAPEPLGAAGGA